MTLFPVCVASAPLVDVFYYFQRVTGLLNSKGTQSWFCKATRVGSEFCFVDLDVMFDFPELVDYASSGENIIAHFEGQLDAVNFTIILEVGIPPAQKQPAGSVEVPFFEPHAQNIVS